MLSRKLTRTLLRCFLVILFVLINLYYFNQPTAETLVPVNGIQSHKLPVLQNSNIINKAIPNQIQAEEKVSKYGNEIYWKSKAVEVRSAFSHAFSSYKLGAYGHDELSPITNQPKDWPGLGEAFSLTLIDSLDTAYIMGLMDIVNESKGYIRDHFIKVSNLSNGDFSFFEAVIRILGGLNSMHSLTADKFYKEHAVKFADLIMFAFENHVIPVSRISFKQSDTGAKLSYNEPPTHNRESTADVTSFAMEFKYLTHITGNLKYWNAAQETTKTFLGIQKPEGLVPRFFDRDNLAFVSSDYGIGGSVDSYYEYLGKQWLLTGKSEDIFLVEWKQIVLGIRKKLIGVTLNGFIAMGELFSGLDGQLTSQTEHLACFLPGTLAILSTGGKALKDINLTERENWQIHDLELAEELARSCYEMNRQTTTGLAPEIAQWVKAADSDSESQKILEYHQNPYRKSKHNVESVPSDAENTPYTRFTFDSFITLPPSGDFIPLRGEEYNQLRPETVESLFILYRITGKTIYRTWAYEIFCSFEIYSRVQHGYSGIV